MESLSTDIDCTDPATDYYNRLESGGPVLAESVPPEGSDTEEILRQDSESFGISARFQDSWLNSKMTILIPKIPVYHIRQ